ncbi:hypothetical protein J2X32_001019 [Rheinheimera pacifica]|uniref:hypothetical protein n=1 Tax=Rheinheimera pacifica TaxID=173990 RepID=UPI00285C2040|nr:hypothetical protein [Rheinheimera pacifica]MDR6982401.1 hypothetical protein [Rheinheimera pacifica]
MRYISLLLTLFLLSCSSDNSKWYQGHWQVTDAKFPGISAMGMDDAKAWFGTKASYTDTKVSFADEVCDKPQFTLTTLVEAEFYSLYRARFQQLGITGESTEILTVGCPSDWVAPGAILIKAENNTAYTLWDGVFFKLDKV